MEQEIPSPGTFNFDKIEQWDSWIELFEKHLFATMHDKSEFEKTEYFFYTMGYGSKIIFKEISETCDTDASYEKTKFKVQTFFKNKKYAVMERWKFVNRLLLPNETMDIFIGSLLKLLSRCEYGQYENVLLREHILTCIQHKHAFELLQKLHTLSIEDQFTNDEELEELGETLGDEIHNTINKFLEEKYQQVIITKKSGPKQSTYMKQHNEEKLKSFHEPSDIRGFKGMNDKPRQRRKGVQYNEPLFHINGTVRLTCMYCNNSNLRKCNCISK